MDSGVPTFSIDDKGPTAARRGWFVLHVKPRTEKKVVTYLKRYRCFAHLPSYVKITKVQRRKVKRVLPLFPGYVFARLSPDERLLMLQTNLLVNTISVPRPREMIHQLRQIARAARGMPDFRPRPNMFRSGCTFNPSATPSSGISSTGPRTPACRGASRCTRPISGSFTRSRAR